MTDETMPGRDLREQIAAALAGAFKPGRDDVDPVDAHMYVRRSMGPGHSADYPPTPREATDAVMAVVQPELDRLTERIPYREGETEEQYLERQIARWRSEAWQARGKLQEADAGRDQLKATLARVRELAVMGGQDPILVRQWIVIEIDQAEASSPDQARPSSADADDPDGPPAMLSISKAALLGLFSCAFMGDDFLLTHGQLREITDALGDDAVIPRRTDVDALDPPTKELT